MLFRSADLAQFIAEVKEVRNGRCRFSHLFLSGTAVTNDGLAFLSQQTASLVVVDLSKTKVSDQTVQRLTNCPKLIVLELSGSKITIASLPTIQKLNSLKVLGVSGTPLAADTNTPQFLPGTNLKLK